MEIRHLARINKGREKNGSSSLLDNHGLTIVENTTLTGKREKKGIAVTPTENIITLQSTTHETTLLEPVEEIDPNTPYGRAQAILWELHDIVKNGVKHATYIAAGEDNLEPPPSKTPSEAPLAEGNPTSEKKCRGKKGSNAQRPGKHLIKTGLTGWFRGMFYRNGAPQMQAKDKRRNT